MSILLYDFHTHTKFSDGIDTISEMVRTAEAVGLSGIAITDHFGKIFNNGTSWVNKMIFEINDLRKKHKIKILTGIESTVLDIYGKTSVTSEIRKKVDLVLCGIEWWATGISKNPPLKTIDFIENVKKCYVNLSKNDNIDIIAHPFNFGRIYKNISLDDFDNKTLKSIAKEFVLNDTIFEIMNEIWWWWPNVSIKRFTDSYARIVKIFANEGVKFSTGSDAHSHQGVGNLGWTYNLIKKNKIPNSQLITPYLVT